MLKFRYPHIHPDLSNILVSSHIEIYVAVTFDNDTSICQYISNTGTANMVQYLRIAMLMRSHYVQYDRSLFWQLL
jgi:hypothetical protein